MKLTGISGTGSGRVGSMVFSVNAGQQIVRQYQPNVSNPSTESQVNQRAKLKLMSQLAASLAPIIVIPKNGLKSSRNQFIAKNFENASASAGAAQITIENVQLTNGNAGLPAIVATRSAAVGVSVALAERCDAAISRVVYAMYSKTSENTLQYVQSVIAENAGADGTFPATLYYTEGDIVLFAYGMKDLSAKATARYTNLNAASGVDIANLLMTRRINTADYQFTRTRGATMFAGENEITPVPEGYARVFVTATNGGSVTGSGTFEIGTNVTVTATPNQGYAFKGWRNNGSQEYISNNPQYTFELEGLTDLVADFEDESLVQYSVELSTYPSAVPIAQVSGAGTYNNGAQVTLHAPQSWDDYDFDGWRLATAGANEFLSTQKDYTFTISGNMDIIAVFHESAQ